MKKIVIQFLLILLLIITSYFFYVKYFKEIKKEDYSKNLDIDTDNIIVNTDQNILKNIEYNAKDLKGREYKIKSKFSKLDLKKPDIVNMEIVDAEISLIGGNKIYISSKKAKYDSITQKTNFYEDVHLNYLEHDIYSDNLDIDYDINILEAYNNLTYKNPETIMNADKLKIDLSTKNSKIFNFDNSNVKIKILKK